MKYDTDLQGLYDTVNKLKDTLINLEQLSSRLKTVGDNVAALTHLPNPGVVRDLVKPFDAAVDEVKNFIEKTAYWGTVFNDALNSNYVPNFSVGDGSMTSTHFGVADDGYGGYYGGNAYIGMQGSIGTKGIYGSVAGGFQFETGIRGDYSFFDKDSKVQAEMYGNLGYKAGGQFQIKGGLDISDLDNINLTAQGNASAYIGVYANGGAKGSVMPVEGYGVGFGIDGKAQVESRGDASGAVMLGTDGLGYAGKASAFAGAGAEATETWDATIGGYKLGNAKGTAGVLTGIGIGAGGNFGIKDGTLSVGFQGEIALLLGLKVDLQLNINYDQVYELLKDGATYVAETLAPVAHAIGEGAQAVGEAAGKAAEAAAKAASAAYNAAKQALDDASKAAEDALNAVGDGIGDVISSAGKAINAIGDQLSEWVDDAGKFISGVFDDIGDFITGDDDEDEIREKVAKLQAQKQQLQEQAIAKVTQNLGAGFSAAMGGINALFNDMGGMAGGGNANIAGGQGVNKNSAFGDKLASAGQASVTESAIAAFGFRNLGGTGGPVSAGGESIAAFGMSRVSGSDGASTGQAGGIQGFGFGKVSGSDGAAVGQGGIGASAFEGKGAQGGGVGVGQGGIGSSSNAGFAAMGEAAALAGLMGLAGGGGAAGAMKGPNQGSNASTAQSGSSSSSAGGGGGGSTGSGGGRGGISSSNQGKFVNVSDAEGEKTAAGQASTAAAGSIGSTAADAKRTAGGQTSTAAAEGAGDSAADARRAAGGQATVNGSGNNGSSDTAGSGKQSGQLNGQSGNQKNGSIQEQMRNAQQQIVGQSQGQQSESTGNTDLQAKANQKNAASEKAATIQEQMQKVQQQMAEQVQNRQTSVNGMAGGNDNTTGQNQTATNQQDTASQSTASGGGSAGASQGQQRDENAKTLGGFSSSNDTQKSAYDAQSAGGAGQSLAGNGQQSAGGGNQSDTSGGSAGGSAVGGGANPENANRFKRRQNQFGGIDGDDEEKDDYT